MKILLEKAKKCNLTNFPESDVRKDRPLLSKKLSNEVTITIKSNETLGQKIDSERLMLKTAISI